MEILFWGLAVYAGLSLLTASFLMFTPYSENGFIANAIFAPAYWLHFFG